MQVDDGLLCSIYHECVGKAVPEEVARRIIGDFHKLFIWAVINNLPDMMYLLWSHGEDFLLKSLTGQCALNLMIEIGGKQGMCDTVISQYKTQKMYEFRLSFNVCFFSALIYLCISIFFNITYQHCSMLLLEPK